MRINGFTTCRVLSAEDVRSMCIQYEYYTRGNCGEYEKMLDYVTSHREDANDAVLIVIAEDIYAHTNIEKMMETYGISEAECMREILFNLFDACRTVVDQLVIVD